MPFNISTIHLGILRGETQLEHLTLHTKGALIDRKRIFVGSLNLDPRSIDINTEMGLLIDSPELGAHLSEIALQRILHLGYRLQLSEDNKITWHATINGQELSKQGNLRLPGGSVSQHGS